MNQNVKTGYKSVCDIDVYYEFYPNQEADKTFVLLHGFLSSSFTFRHLISLLRNDFQILSVDLPPFGKSGKCRRFVYSYQNIARIVIKLTESFGLNKMIFIGHSMGGQIVLNIIHMMPELADKAILLCSSSYLRRAKMPLILSSYIPFFHVCVKYWLSRTGVEKNLQETLYNHSIINDEMIKGYLEPFLQDDIFVALTRMIRHREGDLPSTILNKIKTPCLLIWGDHDKSMPLSVGEKLSRDLVNSELVVLKETGHALPEERPREVYEYIKSFLKKSQSVAN
ncbi:alpha/beta fold hydrolase [Neobacillus fumarioli]|uniref:alpha/beta fold hydrolase n=1 Tax=Neobacillus fumarioli TaxID=105229 RepID=UPI000834472F|nr:alpha/beta hydrolase [Neobacillus fumarioli]